jgi:DNA-binding NarL/FixJ family response regulator
MREIIRVLVADELPMVREGVRALLETIEDVTFIGEAHCGREAFDLCQLYQPDVLLLSLDLPELSLPDMLSEMRQHCHTTKVVVTISDSAKIRQYRLVEAGIMGCIVKSESGEAILEAIRQVHQGNIWFSQPILKEILEHGPNKRAFMVETGLTTREVEVLTLMARGWSNRHIADVLSITVRTVKHHTGTFIAS